MKRFVIFINVLIFMLLINTLLNADKSINFKTRIYPTKFTLNSDIETELSLELRNVGESVLSSIKLSATEDPSILITFEPLTFDSLGVGSTEYFTIRVTPKKTLSKKVESIIFTLNADDYENKQKLTFVILSPKNYWSRIGLFILLFVIILFVVIHIKLKKGEIKND